MELDEPSPGFFAEFGRLNMDQAGAEAEGVGCLAIMIITAPEGRLAGWMKKHTGEWSGAIATSFWDGMFRRLTGRGRAIYFMVRGFPPWAPSSAARTASRTVFRDIGAGIALFSDIVVKLERGGAAANQL
jgi:hypothetical protein